jgi:hypothetical protein
VLALLIFLATAASAPKPPPTPPNPQAAIDITSYGEPADELRELLKPFLGERSFAEARQFDIAKPGYVASEFRRPDGDTVYTLGGPNCLMVGYFGVQRANPPQALEPRERAERFMRQLRRFLDSLPAPRPVARDSRWSWSGWCG